MNNELAKLLKNTFQQRSNNTAPLIPSKDTLVPGERRDVAVLFLDLTGFTAFSELLDHETVHELTTALMDELVSTAKQYSGYIDKIEGDRIMVLFGAIVSCENNSKTAILCAFKMLQTIKIASSILKDAGVPIAAKIGINSGPVTVAPDAIGHITAMGNTVNIASRMQENASTNSILVTDRVYSFCSENILWEKAKQITVKGIAFPIKSWKPISINFLYNPIKCKESINTVFLEKKFERSILESLFNLQTNSASVKNKFGGVRHLIAELTGAPGTGKTRLVSEFLTNHKQNSGVLTLHAHSIANSQPAYFLWSMVILNLLQLHNNSIITDEVIIQRLSLYCTTTNFKNAIPFIRRLVSSTSSDLKFDNMGHKVVSAEIKMALRDLLTALANNHQLIIALDDLQWMDSTDSSILNFIINNCDSTNPILFILCRRSNSDNPLPPAISAKNDYISYKHIKIKKFDQKEILTFSTQFLNKLTKKDAKDISAEALDFLVKHSTGNPFFLQELILHLLASNGFYFNSNSWNLTNNSIAMSTPTSLIDLLQSRLDRLPEPLRKTILNASILGIEFRLDILNSIENKLDIAITDTTNLTELVKQHFLKVSSSQNLTYKFIHSFIQNVAYRSILSHNLKILHKAAAEAIEELVVQGSERRVAQLAEHWEKSGDINEAIKWVFLAQQQASFSYQYSSVLKLGNKLEIWLSDTKDSQLIDNLLTALKRSCNVLKYLGKTKQLKELLDKMFTIATVNQKENWIPNIELLFSSYFTDLREISNARIHLTKALKISQKSNFLDCEANALSSLSVLDGITRQFDSAIVKAKKAVSIFQQQKDRNGEARAIGNLAILYRNLGNTKEAIPLLEKVLLIYTEIKDIRGEAITLGNLGALCSDLNEIERAKLSFSKAIKFFHKLGERMPEAIFTCNLANLLRNELNFSEARTYFLKATATALGANDVRLSAWIQTNFALLYIAEDNLSSALGLYQTAYKIFLEVGDKEYQAVSLAGIAYIYYLIGNTEIALEFMLKTEVIISELKLLSGEFEKTYFVLYDLLSKDKAINTSLPIPWPNHWKKPVFN